MGSPRDGSFLWYRTSISFRGWDPQFCMGLCFGQEDRFWKSGVEIVLNSPGGEIQSERETIVSENGESDCQGWVHSASYIYITRMSKHLAHFLSGPRTYSGVSYS